MEWVPLTVTLLCLFVPICTACYIAVREYIRGVSLDEFSAEMFVTEMKTLAEEQGYKRGIRIAENSSRPPLTKDTIPQELIDIIDAAAGKLHGREGSVVSCLVDVLNKYNELEKL